MDTSQPHTPSLWVPAPTVHNRALAGWFGLDMLDATVLGVLLFVLFLARMVMPMPPIVAVGIVGIAALAVYHGKRGKPRGAILHLLHEWDCPPLPGILPPVEQEYSV